MTTEREREKLKMRKEHVTDAMKALLSWMYQYEVDAKIEVKVGGYTVFTDWDFNGPHGTYRADVRAERVEYLSLDKPCRPEALRAKAND